MKKNQFDPNKRKRIKRAVTLADVRVILNDIGVKWEDKGNNDIWFKCVVLSHKDKDASAHIDASRTSILHGRWHCFGCGASGDIIGLVQDWLQLHFWEAVHYVEARAGEDVSPVRQSVPNVQPTLPSEYEFYTDLDQWNPPYLEYLFGRGILWEQILRHRIGYCDGGKYERHIIAPVMLNGYLRTWVGRHILKKRIASMKHGKVGLFGSRFANPKKGPAVIVEGWADALKIERLGYQNCMAIQTNRLHIDQFEFLKRFEFVLVVPDGDVGGDEFINSLAEFIEEQTFLITHLPRGTDPANLNEDTLEMRIQEAKEWEPVVEGRKVEFEF